MNSKPVRAYRSLEPMIKSSTKAAIAGGMLGLATLWYLDPLGMRGRRDVQNMRKLYRAHDPTDTINPPRQPMFKEPTVSERILGNVDSNSEITSNNVQKFTKDVQSALTADVAPKVDSMISDKTKQKLHNSTQNVVQDITNTVHRKIDDTLRGPHSDLVSDKLHTAADVVAGSVQQYAGSALDAGDVDSADFRSSSR
uniref:1-deoxy-D-xylulose 5-phosphate reductoisomerase n=1 Tax=Lygus hesperus TaxID=30085 RepID=A0A0A9ZB06_LYGHE